MDRTNSNRAAAFVTLAIAAGVFVGCAASTTTWTRETRMLGAKGAVEVYHRRAPYALTGHRAAMDSHEPAQPWTHETRTLGNKVTIDVFRR